MNENANIWCSYNFNGNQNLVHGGLIVRLFYGAMDSTRQNCLFVASFFGICGYNRIFQSMMGLSVPSWTGAGKVNVTQERIVSLF